MQLTKTLFFLFLTGAVYGQYWDFEKPNYDTIESNIKKENSPFLYESLMKRFQAADTTMTLNEKRHLYYGYSFQESYAPYAKSRFTDSLALFMENNPSLDSLAYETILSFTDSILAKNPFDLNALNSQLYIYDKQGAYEMFNNKISKVMILLDALLSSGNGITKEESFYVLFVNHEYSILEYIGFSYGGEQSLRGNHDYLKVIDNESEIEGLYFDISPCLNSLFKSFESEN